VAISMQIRHALRAVLPALAVVAALSASTPALAKTPPATASASTITTGYDIGYPQCPSNFPAGGAFGIVGVNNGLAWSVNPCLAAQYRWATRKGKAAFYMNTANPGTLSTHWGLSGPRTCLNPGDAGSVDDTGCAYNYGWNAAANALSTALSVDAAAATRSWWADVETSNSWDGTTDANFASIQGGLDYLATKGVAAPGVYSTNYQYGTIAGTNRLPAAPNWVAGARSQKQATSWCSSAYSFTGGPVKLVQFPSNGFDGDVSCQAGSLLSA
jgi:hypothetical protein